VCVQEGGCFLFSGKVKWQERGGCAARRDGGCDLLAARPLCVLVLGFGVLGQVEERETDDDE
jgi:hypothetical protein